MKKLLLCLSAALLAAGCVTNRTGVGGGDAIGGVIATKDAGTKGAGTRVMADDSANLEFAPEDARFIRQAAQSGVAEVKTGNLALKNAEDESVKSFAERLVSDHTKINQELRQIAANKGLPPMTLINTQEMQTVSRLSKLSGTEFDRAFAESSVRAHERAVRLFEQEVENGQDSELKAFANKTLPTLQEHLSIARQMDSGKHSYKSNETSLSQ